MSKIDTPSPSEAAAYAKRLKETNALFDRLGYGSRSEAAFDLRIAPSRVSGVLNFREPNATILADLHAWAAAKVAAK